MQIAVIQFPGSNCERETCLAVERVGMTAVNFNWNENSEKLNDCDGFILVGGFSYEDRSRAGIIAAVDPLMDVIKAQSKLGKPILGICNGAQILVETGLVPGLQDGQAAVALTTNKRVAFDKVIGVGFYNAWVHIRKNEAAKFSAFVLGVSDSDFMHIPVAHAEGRFVMPAALEKEIAQHGLDVYHYCSDSGEVVADFPVNPNGSVNNIAAISNYAGNVMAMMPHPERTESGDAIFASMRDYIAESDGVRKGILKYQPEEASIEKFVTDAKTLLVDVVLTDNQAMTVQNCLNQLRLPVTVKRYQHWEIASDDAALKHIMATDELFNPRKEFLVGEADVAADENTLALLVRENEDFVGWQKFQLLANHFEVNGVKKITSGVVWSLSAPDGKIKDYLKVILEKRLLFNPASSRCYFFR